MRSHSSWRSRSTGVMSRARWTISSGVKPGSGTGIDCVGVVDMVDASSTRSQAT
jgi:hypothetical protein